MGVQGVLPRLLSSMGHSIDLRDFQKGILIDDDDDDDDDDVDDDVDIYNNNDEEEEEEEVDESLSPPSQKRPRQESSENKKKKKKRRRRRKIRIGLDASLWISRALHGHGASLLDERLFTNCGRAQLALEQQQDDEEEELQQQQQQSSSTTTNTSNNNINESSNSYKQMAEANYIQKCTQYVLSRITSLIKATNCDLLVVLDGNTPPAKRLLCKERREVREMHARQKEGLQEEKEEEKEEEEEERLKSKIRAAKRAGATSSTSTSTTSPLHTLVLHSILFHLRQKSIPFIIAPYEADSQLAYFSKRNLLDVVITDDSDLIGYGSCEYLLYKVCQKEEEEDYDEDEDEEERKRHHYTPHYGILFQKSDLGGTQNYFSCGNEKLNFMDFSNSMMATTFVAAGCDYCPSLRGIGIVTARNIVKECFHGSLDVVGNSEEEDDSSSSGGEESEINVVGSNQQPPLQKVLHKLFQSTYDRTKLSYSDKRQYESKFLSALLSFRHGVVYDVTTKSCKFSNLDLKSKEEEEEEDRVLKLYQPYAKLCESVERMEGILGRLYEDDEAVFVAEGWINPKTNRLYCENGGEDVPRDVLEWLEKKKDEEKEERRRRQEEEDEEKTEEVSTGAQKITKKANQNTNTQNNQENNDNTNPEENTNKKQQTEQQQQSQQQQSQQHPAEGNNDGNDNNNQISSASTQTTNSQLLDSQPSSTNQSQRSSNLSVDVLSPNLLPSPYREEEQKEEEEDGDGDDDDNREEMNGASSKLAQESSTSSSANVQNKVTGGGGGGMVGVIRRLSYSEKG